MFSKAVSLFFFAMASCFSLDAMAKCIMASGGPYVLSFPARNIITAGRDVPINTVLYREVVSVGGYVYNCGGRELYGLQPDAKFGSNPAKGSSVFPIGNTGLGFSLDVGWEMYSVYGSTLRQQSGYISFGDKVTLSIIKISDFSAGRPLIPGGHLGKLMAGDLLVYDFNLSDDSQMVFGSCRTPDVIVRMGDGYQMSHFDKGATPPLIKFGLRLLQCPEGLKSITYRIENAPGVPVINGADGLIGLNKGSSAKGVGLKITDEAGSAIVLGKTYSLNSYQGSSGDYEIPLNASYVKLPGKNVVPGNADTEATFIMSYM